jgi:GAF domain-containing protein
VETAVSLVTRLAVATIPVSVGAGVTLVDAHGKRSTAASDALVERADELQYELDDGPCLTAWRERVAVLIDDVELDTRWPEWTAAAGHLGIESVLSVPLVAGGECLGAIKVYAREPGVYDAHAETLMRLFAQQAAILLANTQTVADARELSGHLAQALRSRDVVSQAKGVLLAQGAGDDQRAFGMLVAASQRSMSTVEEVALRIVASVTVDGPGRSAV